MNALLRRPGLIFAFCVIASLALSFRQHGFRVDIQPDSGTYTDFDWSSLTAVLSNVRTPGYPLFLRFAGAISASRVAVPMAQWLAWLAAALILLRGLTRVGYRPHVAAGAAGVVLLGQGALTFTPTVLADSLACALAVAATGCFLGVLPPASSPRRWIGLVATTFLAYQMRPAYLFLIPLWPCLQLWLDPWLLRRGCSWRLIVTRSIAFSAATAVPFVAYCTLRWVVVGHWGLVSFGGLNLIGVVGQFLQTDDVAALPGTLQPIAQDMLEHRAGLPDYQPPASYLAMEQNFNPTVWSLAAPAATRAVGDDGMAVNRVLSQLAGELLQRHRAEYAQWLVWNGKHALREVAQLVLLDRGTLLLMIVCLLGQTLWLFRPATSGGDETIATPAERRLELQCLFWIAVGFTAAKSLLVLLVEPAIGRYMIGAMPLLPPTLAVLVVHYLEYLRAPAADVAESVSLPNSRQLP
jgi:hypothetical protein